MKTKLLLVVAALQLLVLGFMAGQREWILHRGAPLILRTAPVDPDDPMRGAYVRLAYEISFVPAAQCTGEIAKWVQEQPQPLRTRRDAVVYAALRNNSSGIAELVSLSDVPPRSGPFLRGRAIEVDRNGATVRYGIEAQFMDKGSAQRTERLGVERQGAPMNVTVAVGASGIAVLKDTAWEPLGITLAFERRPRPAGSDPQRWLPRAPSRAIVTLHNYSDRPTALVDRPGGRSFSLVPNLQTGHLRYRWAPKQTADAPALSAGDIVVLQPGQKHTVRLDFDDPRWFVIDSGKPDAAPVSLADLPPDELWSFSFRIEYSPPEQAAVRGLPHAELIRHAPLRSRAFNAGQGVD